MLQCYVNTAEALKRLHLDQAGVVSFEYIMLAVSIVARSRVSSFPPVARVYKVHLMQASRQSRARFLDLPLTGS